MDAWHVFLGGASEAAAAEDVVALGTSYELGLCRWPDEVAAAAKLLTKFITWGLSLKRLDIMYRRRNQSINTATSACIT